MVVIIRLKVIIIKKRTVNSTFFYDCSMGSKIVQQVQIH